MIIKGLTLANFRNYEQLSCSFSEKINWIVGLNGMGKTSLLEAIHYLCVCKSPFAGSDRTVMREGSDFFRIVGHFQRNESLHMVEARVVPGKSKTILLDGSEYDRLVDHLGLITAVVISPYDQDLVEGGSEERRNFINSALCQLDKSYLEGLLTYNRILRQRNSLLKSGRDAGYVDQTLLQTYSQQLVAEANSIFPILKTFVDDIGKRATKYYSELAGFDEAFQVQYRSHLNGADFAHMLEESYDDDRKLGRTNVGLHKDDILLQIREQAIKRFGSQGQRKTAILALKLAVYDLFKEKSKSAPLLLLDDIFDRLDRSRVRKLLTLFQQQGFGQVFITDTHAHRVGEILDDLELDYCKFEILNGEIIDHEVGK